LNLYNDLTFPVLAHECRADLTDQWAASWKSVPLLGSFVVDSLFYLRFWGASALLAAAAVLTGLVGACRLLDAPPHAGHDVRTAMTAPQYAQMLPVGCGPDGVPERRPGRYLVALAGSADNAGVPSAAMLCQEIALQRRWVFDAKDEEGGALESARVRESVVFGKLNRESLDEHELRDRRSQADVENGLLENLRELWGGRMLVGNMLQLWLQATFLQLAFGRLAYEARIKLILRIAVSGLHLFARATSTTFRFGCAGTFYVSLSLLMVAWAFAKAYFAFTCPSHVWDLASGLSCGVVV